MKQTDASLPNLKQLTLTEEQLDYIAASASLTAAVLVGDTSKVVLCSLAAQVALRRLGADGLDGIFKQVALLLEIE